MNDSAVDDILGSRTESSQPDTSPAVEDLTSAGKSNASKKQTPEKGGKGNKQV